MKRPPYTFDEMVQIERHADRVLSAALTFADDSYYESILATRFLVGQMRYAAGMLKGATDEESKQIAEGLLHLLKERPNE